jgi:hypothetical protein
MQSPPNSAAAPNWATLSGGTALVIGWSFGFLAWGEGRAPTLAVLLPLLFIGFSRSSAIWLMLGYYAAAVRGVVTASAAFYAEASHPTVVGIVLWLALVCLLTAPWGVASLAGKRYPRLAGGFAVLAMIALMVPPLGIVGAANPWLGVGWILPGTGWLGLAGYVLLLIVYPVLRRSKQVLVSVAILGVLFTLHGEETHIVYEGIKAVQTRWGAAPTSLSEVVDRMTLIGQTARQEAARGTTAIVFPELVLGSWSDNYRQVWDIEIRKQTRRSPVDVAVGAGTATAQGQMANSLLVAHAGHTEAVSARQTVPVSMYRPWEPRGGYAADWSRREMTTIGGKKALVLFCYEEYLPGLALSTLVRSKPDFILSVASTWWSAESSGRIVQKRHAESIAVLFGLPLVRAENTY